MTKEFSDTDGELARCIHSRIKHELASFPRPNSDISKQEIKEYIIELTGEIINDYWSK